MTILEGLTRDIKVLNNIKTPNGVTMKDFMENIGLPIYNVVSDLETMVHYMKNAQKQVEEAHKDASSENEATEEPKIEILEADQADEEEEPAWDPTPAEK